MSALATLRAWAPRVLAPVAAVGVGLAFYVLTNLPYAARSEGPGVAPWKAARGETLTLGYAPSDLKADTPLVSIQGAAGRTLNATFTGAAFGPATEGDLAITGRTKLIGQSPAAWVSYGGGTARQALDFTLQPTGAHPTLSIKQSDNDTDSARMTLTARDARLAVHLEASLDPAAPPPEIVGPGAAWRLQLRGGEGGGFPIDVVVPAGQPVVVSVPRDALAATGISLGSIAEIGDPPILMTRTLAIRGRGETVDRLRACGAKERAVAWTTDVSLDHCQPLLRVVKLDLDDDGVAVGVNGRAFVARDGEALVLPLQKVTENPLVSAAVGAASAWLVAWAWTTLTARRKRPPPRKRKPAKAAAPG